MLSRIDNENAGRYRKIPKWFYHSILWIIDGKMICECTAAIHLS